MMMKVKIILRSIIPLAFNFNDYTPDTRIISADTNHVLTNISENNFIEIIIISNKTLLKQNSKISRYSITKIGIK